MDRRFKHAAVICLAVLCLCLCACGSSSEEVPAEPAETSVPEATSEPVQEEAAAEEEAAEEEAAEEAPAAINMENVLFIGDSRTVGLNEYADLPSDFFATEGMSSYNIYDNYCRVDGKLIQLGTLLEDRDYEDIFLMLGLNEIGYPFDEVMEKFSNLVIYLRQTEPEAKLIIMADLHVSDWYSDGHPYINNPNINELNSRMSEYADGENIFFLDVNSVYDDENGALNPELTSDGVHFYAKHYAEWGQWICENAAALIAG